MSQAPGGELPGALSFFRRRNGGLHCAGALCREVQRSEGAHENVSARNESRSLKGFARRDVVEVAAGGGGVAVFVGGALEFLDGVGAETAAAELFGDGHIEVAVGAVVVEEDAAGGGDRAVGEFEDVVGAVVEFLCGDLRGVGGGGAAEGDAVGGGVIRRELVVEED